MTMIPDWLLPTFVLLPALLWMFLGVGGAWALALLPRSDWRKPATVIGVALALGPAMTTVPMFLIGTFGRFSAINAVVGSVIMALIGGALALRNRGVSSVGGGHDRPLREDRRLQQKYNAVDLTLIAVIVISVLIRFWNTAYWPYTTYDEFWVYGYNAKLFMLRESIPTTMGYYPQLVPLSYTFMQLMWGAINDHAARTVVPVFALASILMAYLLGARLFNRRVGLLTAAIWALYPHHTAWSQFGDLEVPTTLYFTATVAFFALAWKSENRRYAILSGVMMGAGLWTKPTSGALIESLFAITVVATTRWMFSRRLYSRIRREYRVYRRYLRYIDHVRSKKKTSS